MRFIDRKLSDLTVAACDNELDRAKKAYTTYASAVRATKRFIEAKINLYDMGDGQAETEAADGSTTPPVDTPAPSPASQVTTVIVPDAPPPEPESPAATESPTPESFAWSGDGRALVTDARRRMEKATLPGECEGIAQRYFDAHAGDPDLVGALEEISALRNDFSKAIKANRGAGSNAPKPRGRGKGKADA